MSNFISRFRRDDNGSIGGEISLIVGISAVALLALLGGLPAVAHAMTDQLTAAISPPALVAK